MARLRALDLGALFRGRCPRCHEGPIFGPLMRRPLAMNAACPNCRLVFEREPGYFLGAMYVSYMLGVLTVLRVSLALLLLLYVAWPVVVAIALIQTLLTMVVSFRFSRVVWLYIDQVLDPR